jgi:hypothetical protein
MQKFPDRMKTIHFLLSSQYLDSQRNFLYEILSLSGDQ